MAPSLPPQRRGVPSSLQSTLIPKAKGLCVTEQTHPAVLGGFLISSARRCFSSTGCLKSPHLPPHSLLSPCWSCMHSVNNTLIILTHSNDYLPDLMQGLETQ